MNTDDMIEFPTSEFWKVFKETNGALSCSEAIAIFNIAKTVRSNGVYLELGTFHGKSAMSASLAFNGGAFNLVDPIFEDKEIANRVAMLVANVTPYSPFAPTIAAYSTDIIEKFRDLCYVMVDSGSHQDGLPMREVKMLEDRVISGGVVVFHDYHSQFVEVEQAYNYLVGTGKYTPIKIEWDIINDYVRRNKLEDGNQTWHHTEMDCPNFVGALRRK